MRLIDADYGQKQLTIAEVECGKNFETDCNHVRDFLNAMPTIDAVPVVRCKDCLYSTDSWAKVNEKGFLICPASGMEITDMDYCSYGERKDGDA